MSYHLELAEPVTTSIKRVACERVRHAVDQLDSPADPHDAVHEARKDMKKLRAGIAAGRAVAKPRVGDSAT